MPTSRFFRFLLLLLLTQTLSFAVNAAVLSPEVQRAFEFLGIPQNASKSEATNVYWERRDQVKGKRQTFEQEKVELAWKWLLHHYNTSNGTILRSADPPTRSLIKLLADPLAVPEGIETDYSYDIVEALKTLEVNNLSTNEVKRQYWRLMGEYDSYTDPYLKEAIAKRKAKLELAWEWAQYGLSPESRPLPAQSLVSVPEKKTRYQAKMRKEELSRSKRDTLEQLTVQISLSLEGTPADEIPLKMAKAFKNDGIEGVLAFLDPLRPTRALGESPSPPGVLTKTRFTEIIGPRSMSPLSARAIVEAQNSLSHYLDPWIEKATREQKLFLARVIELKLSAFGEKTMIFEVEKMGLEIKTQKKELHALLGRIVDPLIRTAETPEEYASLLKEWAKSSGLLWDKARLNSVIFVAERERGPETALNVEGAQQVTRPTTIAEKNFGVELESISSDPFFQRLIQPFVCKVDTKPSAFQTFISIIDSISKKPQ